MHACARYYSMPCHGSFYKYNDNYQYVLHMNFFSYMLTHMDPIHAQAIDHKLLINKI